MNDQDRSFVGRATELRSLAVALGSDVRPACSIVCVSGEAGVGKTHLTDEALRRSGLPWSKSAAHPGFTPPYGPLAMVLRDALASRRLIARSLGGIRSTLAAVLPELGPRSDPSDRQVMFDAFATAFRILGRERGVVVLDDLHWADGATLQVLPALASEILTTRLTLICSFRTDELGRSHPLRLTRAQLRRALTPLEIDVSPLGESDTAALLAHVLGASPGPVLIGAVHARTEGLPLFIEQIALALRDRDRLEATGDGRLELRGELPMPDTLRETILLRAMALAGAGRRAVEAAAVVGTTFRDDLVGELEPGDLQLAADVGLVERGHGARDDWSFRHALVRDVIYAEIPDRRKRQLHSAVAERCERDGAPNAIVAEHRLAARQTARARELLIAAAEDLARVAAHADAARTLRRALELWPESENESGRVHLLDRLGGCLRLAGDEHGAIAAWTEALDAHRRTGRTADVARVARCLAAVYFDRDDASAELPLRRIALDALLESGDVAEAITERIRLADALESDGDVPAAVAAVREASADALRRERDDLLALTLTNEGYYLAELGRSTEAVATARRGLEMALGTSDAATIFETYWLLAATQDHTNRAADAATSLRRAAEFCGSREMRPEEHVCLGCLTKLLYKIGDWREGLRVSRRVLASKERARTDRQIAGRAFAAYTIGAVYVARGRLREARPMLDQAVRFATAVHYPGPVIDARHASAELELAAGHDDAGLAGYRGILADVHSGLVQRHLPQILRDAATAFALHGDDAGLAKCAERAAQLVADLGGDDAMAAMGHVLGESLIRQGAAARACDQFARATDLLRAMTLPYWGARTQVRYGIALAAGGDREPAVEQLTEAYRTARHLAARTLASTASSHLHRLGANLHRSADAAADGEHARGLTRREVQVLRALATGDTNREIAERLFLSPRTIDMHVRNILSKLDCHTRTEAVVAADELQLLRSTRSDAEQGLEHG